MLTAMPAMPVPAFALAMSMVPTKSPHPALLPGDGVLDRGADAERAAFAR